MNRAGPDDKVFPIQKVALIVEALMAEGATVVDALNGVRLTKKDLSSPVTRVSIAQVLRCCRNATRLASDPGFAFHTGRRLHVTSYGLYGFAILSSTDFRTTMRFAQVCHDLATPLADIAFAEDAERAVWTITPIAHPLVDASLYRFLVEFYFGIFVSMHRDCFGAAFSPRQFEVVYERAASAENYQQVFGAPVVFKCRSNRLVFDGPWLDGEPEFGNALTFASVSAMCDELLAQMELHIGLPGKVRHYLMTRMMRPTSLEATALHLHISPRTLRRQLKHHNTSFRKLVHELRMSIAIKYLRETVLPIEGIASVIGFSDAASFRKAFRRWTDHPPHEYRSV